MEIENTSSTDSSSNSETMQNIDNPCKESGDEQRKKNQGDHDLTLDLRSVLPSSDPCPSENEDSLEKLSAVLEQSEDSMMLDEEDKELTYILRERIESLSEIMKTLGQELKREIELWRREREEYQLLREKDDALALEEATAAARAAAAAYAAESPLSNTLDITSEDVFRELTILEYEKRLAKYQDEYSLSQAEKRYNACWKMIANVYKQKLIEVERLCNEELEKVQKNVNHLQPLKDMISQWYIDEEEGQGRGDSIKRTDFIGTALKPKNFNEDDIRNDTNKYQKIDAEVNMAPEMFAARFKSDDLEKKDKFYG
ncbi:uncharacterized protein LOC108628249 [Ceratina calcarata]|uniref:Uncharacterized protein LOC108628249 n=1 Tax=Ceratina calcarata TaxID=156304 RepID=A0AAJ7S607_9HYME|nr:uncharacterized protein LOC108628249 [Ceratina calcarata]